MSWIKVREIPDIYKIGRSKAYQLVREFKVACKSDYITDGKITILRQDKFENWWKQRGERHG